MFPCAISCLTSAGFIEYETPYKCLNWGATPRAKEQWEKLAHTTEMLKAAIKRHPNKPEDPEIDIAIHALATVVEPENLRPFIRSYQPLLNKKEPLYYSYLSRQVLDMAGFLLSNALIHYDYFRVSAILCAFAGACIESGGDADSGADLMIRILNILLPLLYAFDTSNKDSRILQHELVEKFTQAAVAFITNSAYAQEKVQQDTKLRNLVRRNRKKSVLLNKLIQSCGSRIITVVHCASKKVWDVSLCGCSDNFQLLGLLAYHFITGGIIGEDEDKVSKRFKSVWDGSGPPSIVDYWICPWDMVNWTGLLNDKVDCAHRIKRESRRYFIVKR